MRENPELLAALVKAFPYPFLAGLKEMIPRLYMEAHEAVSSDPLIGPPEAEYLIPHYRRGLIEKGVRDLAEATKMHTSVLPVLPNLKQASKYTLIRSGNFICTVSYLNDLFGQVRGAEFRNSHSKLNKLLSQKSLEGFAEDEALEAIDSPIYCLLLHKADPFDKRIPGFMKWAFPHPNGNGWIAEFDFAKVIQAATDLSPAKQNDGALPKLKKDKDEGMGG